MIYQWTPIHGINMAPKWWFTKTAGQTHQVKDLFTTFIQPHPQKRWGWNNRFLLQVVYKKTKPTPIIYTPSPKTRRKSKTIPFSRQRPRSSHRRENTEARRLEIGNSILGEWLGVKGGSFQGEKPGELGEMEVNMARSWRQQRRFRWWQLKYVLCLSLIWGRWTHFYQYFFQMGWFNHQLEEILIKGRMFDFVFFGGGEKVDRCDAYYAHIYVT